MKRRERNGAVGLGCVATLVLLVMAAAVLAGCLGGTEAPDASDGARVPAGERGPTTPGGGDQSRPPDAVLTDPEGDAYEWNGDWADDNVPCITVQPSPVQPSQACAVAAEATGAEQGVVPAPPAVDLTGVSFVEHPGVLDVVVHVAGLPQDLSGAVDLERGKGAFHWVEWGTNDAGEQALPVQATRIGPFPHRVLEPFREVEGR